MEKRMQVVANHGREGGSGDGNVQEREGEACRSGAYREQARRRRGWYELGGRVVQGEGNGVEEMS